MQSQRSIRKLTGDSAKRASCNMGSAYAGFQEREIGSIEKGKRADKVIWEKDFYSTSSKEIKEAKAKVTIVGGNVVYEKNERLTLLTR